MPVLSWEVGAPAKLTSNLLGSLASPALTPSAGLSHAHVLSLQKTADFVRAGAVLNRLCPGQYLPPSKQAGHVGGDGKHALGEADVPSGLSRLAYGCGEGAEMLLRHPA